MSASEIPKSFIALRMMTCAQLAAFGCRRWDDSGLMLFPVGWYDSIPEGFMVRTIRGTDEAFSKSWPAGKRDQRYGMLAFGIVGREPKREQIDD